MSEKKQRDAFEVVAEPGIWPYYARTGMPVLPRKRDCIGEDCYALQTRGRCSPNSEHHLLFIANRFKRFGYPYDQLVTHSLLISTMAECRHNSFQNRLNSNAIHALYDRSAIPERPTAFQFLDEARLLGALSKAVTDIRDSLDRYVRYPELDAKSRYELSLPRAIDGRADRFAVSEAKFQHCIDQIGTIEVIPEPMVNRYLNEALNRRARMRAVFEENFEVVPYPLFEVVVDSSFMRTAA